MGTANQDRTRVEVLRRRDYPTTDRNPIIRVGDMVMDDGSHFAMNASGTADQVADAFLGVSLHQTGMPPLGSMLDIAVAVDCVAEMDIFSGLAAAAHVGDSVEFDGSLGNSQTVKLGGTDPIGKLYREAPLGATTVMVHFVGRDVRSPVVAD